MKIKTIDRMMRVSADVLSIELNNGDSLHVAGLGDGRVYIHVRDANKTQEQAKRETTISPARLFELLSAVVAEKEGDKE